MSVFHYPKFKLTRKYKPRARTNYRGFKPYLQREFERTCVYCRQPDSLAPNLNFGADHYRPKSRPEFASLVCDYSNLYYCCSGCNTRKSDYWPDDKKLPSVVNPCEFEMAKHLRFNSETCEMESRSAHGEHTIELLQLNTSELTTFRRHNLRMIALVSKDIQALEHQRTQAAAALAAGQLPQATFDANIQAIGDDLADLASMLQRLTGNVPLRALRQVLTAP